MARWRFYDPVELDTYVFEISPNEGGSPQFKKTVQYQNTAGPNGNVLMFEGRDETQTLEASGVILTEDQYNAMIDWFGRRHQIEITDDLERTFTIYITSFLPKRRRALQHPWKHDYNFAYTVLDWLA